MNNPKLIRNIEEHNEKKTSASSTRTVSKATIEKWKIEVANYFVNDWFEYSEDREGNPTSMRCKYCVMLGLQIFDVRLFCIMLKLIKRTHLHTNIF